MPPGTNGTVSRLPPEKRSGRRETPTSLPEFGCFLVILTWIVLVVLLGIGMVGASIEWWRN